MARVAANRVFPFFVSCGRSGSTLLRSMFDSHPDLAIPGESYFITELLPNRKLYEGGSDGFDTSQFIADVLRLNWTTRAGVPTWIDRWGIDQELLTDQVLEVSPATYPDAVRAVFGTYARWKGKDLYGDKTPAYVTKILTIAELLPESRFIHLVRDGRNVALAFLNAPFGPRTIEEIALHWQARVMAGREAGERLGPTRYMEVQYEELVASAAEVLDRTCRWLDLPYTDSMLDHRESVKGLGLGFDRAHQNVLRPVQKGMRDWRSQLSRPHLETFEFLAGDALDSFGYPRACREFSMLRRSETSARRAYLSVKKASRRVRGLSSADWW